MGVSGGKAGETGQPEDQQAVAELFDRYHPRASISGGGRLVVRPDKILENVALAMERLDVDIDTPISIEEDVVTFDELAGMVQSMAMGPLLAVHVVNTAFRIMSARYPEELVRSPLPARYDLRQITPLAMSDREHEIAKSIFNRRTASTEDFDNDDVAADLEPLNAGDQVQVFVALFYMYGNKIGAMKYTTGIK